MEKRTLGATDLELTTIGLGSWAIGGAGWAFAWGEQDDDAAVRALLRGVELGINWIDTAPVYGVGHAEELVGRALRELGTGSLPYVATKCGRIAKPDGTVIGRLRAESVREECEASLRRLGVDAIDLYQMHWPDPDEDIEEAWSAMADLRREGKVRHIGLSNAQVGHMERLRPIHPIASLQPPYNLIVRRTEEDLLPYCAEHRIGVVAYSPLSKGLLTGAFTKERARALSADDHRSRDPKFSDPQLEIHLDLVSGLRTIARAAGRTPAELAIVWVLRRPEVTSAIVGARAPRQIEGTAPAAGWELSKSEIAAIDALVARHASEMERLGAETGRV